MRLCKDCKHLVGRIIVGKDGKLSKSEFCHKRVCFTFANTPACEEFEEEDKDEYNSINPLA